MLAILLVIAVASPVTLLIVLFRSFHNPDLKISKLSSASSKCVFAGFLLFFVFWFFLVLFGRLQPVWEVLRMITLIIPAVLYFLGIIFGIKAWKVNNAKRAAIIGIFLLSGQLVIICFVLGFLAPVLPISLEGRRYMCMRNVRSLNYMCYMYRTDHGVFPSSFESLERAKYEIETSKLCPTDFRKQGPGSYGLNTAATMDCPPGTPLVGDFDSSNHGDRGGNIGYVDGNVRWYDGEYSAGSGPLKDVLPEDWVRQY